MRSVRLGNTSLRVTDLALGIPENRSEDYRS